MARALFQAKGNSLLNIEAPCDPECVHVSKKREIENACSFSLSSFRACRDRQFLAFQNFSSPRASSVRMLQAEMVILVGSSLTHLRIHQLVGHLCSPTIAQIPHSYLCSGLLQPHWIRWHLAAHLGILPFGISEDSSFHQRWAYFLSHSTLAAWVISERRRGGEIHFHDGESRGL